MLQALTLNCLKITLLLVYLDASIGWSFSVCIKKNGLGREFSSFFKKFVFSTKSYTEESSILFNASESTYSDGNNWIENALKLDCSAYSTMYPNFVLLVKISILIAYSSKGAQDNNSKKQKSHLVLMCLAIMYM